MAAPALPPPAPTLGAAPLTRAAAAVSPLPHLEPIPGTTSLALGPPPGRAFSGPVRLQFAEAMADHFADAVDPDRAHLYSRAHPDQRFRGVTKHKRTQRYEAHIWECKKQIYLGGFDSEVLAAKSHDIMALRCKGPGCEILNYSGADYVDLLPLIERLSREDIITALRNYSKGQTAARMGTSPTSPGVFVSQFAPAAVATGRVAKRRGSMPAPPSPRTAAQLSAASVRRRRQRRRLAEPLSSSDEEDEERYGATDVEDGDYLPPALHVRTPPSFSLRGAQSAPAARRRGTGRCPGALPPPCASAGGATPLRSYAASPASTYFGAAAGGPAPLAGRPLSGSGARLRHTGPSARPAASSFLSADDASAFDSLDLGRMLSHLADEPSLTYSACDESYLFEALPALGGGAAGSVGPAGSAATSGVTLNLGHLGGRALLGGGRELPPLVPLQARSGSGSSPDTPQSTLVAATPFAAAPVLPSTVLAEGAPWPGGAWGPRTPLPTQTAQSLGMTSPFAGGLAWGHWG